MTPLLPQQPATLEGQRPSPELVEVLQRIVRKLDELERRVRELEP